MTDETNNEVSSEEQVSETFTDATDVQTLSLQELDQIAQVIDLASQRGAFRGGELSAVGALYNKLVTFLSSVKAQQEAAAADSQSEDVAEEGQSDTEAQDGE
tara:strand:+ start:294 stop:599 length:306 start_codon:yes stop_codon:yes gene_type:complete